MSALDALSRNPDAASIFMAGVAGGLMLAVIVGVALILWNRDR